MFGCCDADPSRIDLKSFLQSLFKYPYQFPPQPAVNSHSHARAFARTRGSCWAAAVDLACYRAHGCSRTALTLTLSFCRAQEN